MAGGSGNSAAGVLSQLVKLLNHSVVNKRTKLTIPLVLFYLPRPAPCQRVKYGMEIVAVPQL